MEQSRNQAGIKICLGHWIRRAVDWMTSSMVNMASASIRDIFQGFFGHEQGKSSPAVPNWTDFDFILKNFCGTW